MLDQPKDQSARKVEMTLSLRYFCRSIPAFILVGMLFSCSGNDLKDVETVNATDDTPLEVSYDVEISYTDSGMLKARLVSPEVQRFADEETVHYSPNGIDVMFYDSAMNEDSHMHAQRGKFFENQRRVELRDSVVVTSQGGEMLETEFLVWVQDSGFYTDKYVKITKEKTILHGQGLTANEHFTKYKITKPFGEITINKGATEAKAENEEENATIR